MAGMRVLAAACAALAAWPAAGQDGALQQGLDDMARSIASLLNEEAQRAGGEPPRVSFRPAWSESQGVRYYCGPLSRGLRDALHEGVQRWRDDMSLSSFAIAIADERKLSPPEATLQWRWDGAASVEATARVQLPGRRGRVVSAQLNVDALDGGQRDCLFSFEPGGREAKAERMGFLREDPMFDPLRATRFASGDEFFVLGYLVGRGSVWSVVHWEDPDTGEPRNMFTMDLPAPRDLPVTRGGGGNEDDAAFASARSVNTVAAFDEYLSSFPSGRHVAEARRLREEAVDPPLPPGTVFRDCPHCPEMVVVPAGRFEMGSPASEEGRYDSEGPQHEVTFDSPFAVGVYEVTFDEWDACVSGGGCGGYRPDDEGWGRGGRPVINVSWEDARAYAEWLSGETGESYRLLSEAEWEYVARAGTVTRFWWGDAIGLNRANCDDSCGDHYANPSPVGSFGANAFGLHDVHGNVWEWVEDCLHENYARAPRDGRAWLGGQGGDCSRHVLRGGSWLDVPLHLRSAVRNGIVSGTRNYIFGFRLFRPVRTFTP